MVDVISRMLHLQNDKTIVDVPVRLLWPVEGEAAWACRWEIDWPDRRRSNCGYGVDAVQALLHALQMVGAELYSSDEHRMGRLTWDKDWAGYGFPVPGAIRDLLGADDAKNV